MTTIQKLEERVKKLAECQIELEEDFRKLLSIVKKMGRIIEKLKE